MVQKAADQRFAPAVAVYVRGIKEIDPVLHCFFHDREGGLLSDVAEVTAELPATEAHFADAKTV